MINRSDSKERKSTRNGVSCFCKRQARIEGKRTSLLPKLSCASRGKEWRLLAKQRGSIWSFEGRVQLSSKPRGAFMMTLPPVSAPAPSGLSPSRPPPTRTPPPGPQPTNVGPPPTELLRPQSSRLSFLSKLTTFQNRTMSVVPYAPERLSISQTTMTPAATEAIIQAVSIDTFCHC